MSNSVKLRSIEIFFLSKILLRGSVGKKDKRLLKPFLLPNPTAADGSNLHHQLWKIKRQILGDDQMKNLSYFLLDDFGNRSRPWLFLPIWNLIVNVYLIQHVYKLKVYELPLELFRRFVWHFCGASLGHPHGALTTQVSEKISGRKNLYFLKWIFRFLSKISMSFIRRFNFRWTSIQRKESMISRKTRSKMGTSDDGWCVLE